MYLLSLSVSRRDTALDSRIEKFLCALMERLLMQQQLPLPPHMMPRAHSSHVYVVLYLPDSLSTPSQP